jgi:hypothetical protein
MDNIKDVIPLAAVSSAKSLKSVDHRENNNRNYLFKDTFKKKQKKKKRKGPMHVKISTSATLIGERSPIRQSAEKKKAKEFIQKRTIDIVI